MNPSFRGPFWFGIGLLAVIAAIGAWFYFLQPVQKNLNVNVALATNPSNAFVGDPFDLSVVTTNNADSQLTSATIEVVLPQDIVSADVPTQRVITQSIGTIQAGAVSHEDFQLVGIGGQNSVIPIAVKVMYSSPDSSAQFESDATIGIPLQSPAIGLSVSAPTNVFSGQNFPLALTYNNNTGDALPNFSIALQYPPAFNVASASSSPSAAAGGPTFKNDSSWNLGTIPANASGTVIVSGNLVGPNQASYPIGIALNEMIGGKSYPIQLTNTDVALAPSPLSLSISLNSMQNYIAGPGVTLNYTISYTNNSLVAFQNALITANLQGGMFNLASVRTDGSFNSIVNTISWNPADDSDLLSIAPGQSGMVSFTVQTKEAFPIRLPSDKNYTVAVSARIASPTVPAGTSASSTISVANLTTQFGGNIVLSATAYHKDPSLPLSASSSSVAIKANTGPFPPRVNQSTEYTIHWLLTNYATDAQNVSISAYLQSGTTCTGSVSVPASTTFSCDPGSGQVTWTVPFVAATTGITDKPLEAVFQVSNTPAVNQVNQDVTLIGGASLSATDVFTNSSLQSSIPAITTELPNDTSVPAYPRSVTQ